jgi:hypothetical protein
MNFIEGMFKSEGKDIILVVVDKLTKYSHFISLIHPFTTKIIVQLFLYNVFKPYRLSLVIIKIIVQLFLYNVFKPYRLSLVVITDRGRIFTS